MMQAFRVLLVLALAMVAIWAYDHHQAEQAERPRRDAVRLLQSKRISLDFEGGPITKGLEQFVDEYDPVQRRMAIGGLANQPTSYRTVHWDIRDVSSTIFVLSATNAKYGASYEFEVNTMTGEVKGLNDNARMLLRHSI